MIKTLACLYLLDFSFSSQELYKSKHPDIKVRALVGLCKCASSGGQDASQVYMADQSYQQLMKVTRKFLLNPTKVRLLLFSVLILLVVDVKILKIL